MRYILEIDDNFDTPSGLGTASLTIEKGNKRSYVSMTKSKLIDCGLRDGINDIVYSAMGILETKILNQKDILDSTKSMTIDDPIRKGTG
jgi:hypothetical protein